MGEGFTRRSRRFDAGILCVFQGEATQDGGRRSAQTVCNAYEYRFYSRIVAKRRSCDLNIELTTKEFRRLLDLVYIGNWILNSTRGDDRFTDYDHVESKLFSLCRKNGMGALVERWEGEDIPSQAFADGGIHEAIMDYEDTVFFEILAEELARRDMGYAEVSDSNYDELVSRMDDYIAEFEAHGTDNLCLTDTE